MSVTDELVPVLKKLRLSGVLKTLDLRTREAVDGDLSHGEFLFRLCCDEIERRESKQLELRLRRASFETTKRLEDFEWAFNPRIPRARVVDLATCNFVEKRENALLIGPTGVGKSHLAQAIGERACRAGHSVCYVTAHRMLSTLRAARADQSYDKKLLRFTTPDLLILDDVGLCANEHSAQRIHEHQLTLEFRLRQVEEQQRQSRSAGTKEESAKTPRTDEGLRDLENIAQQIRRQLRQSERAERRIPLSNTRIKAAAGEAHAVASASRARLIAAVRTFRARRVTLDGLRIQVRELANAMKDRLKDSKLVSFAEAIERYLPDPVSNHLLSASLDDTVTIDPEAELKGTTFTRVAFLLDLLITSSNFESEDSENLLVRSIENIELAAAHVKNRIQQHQLRLGIVSERYWNLVVATGSQ